MYKKPNPIKQLIEKGKMLSSAKGSSNYMKKDSKSAILAIGDIGKPGYDKYGAELMSTKRARLKKEKGDLSSKNQPVDSLYGRGKRPTIEPTIKPKETPPKVKTTKNTIKSEPKDTKSVPTPRKKVKSVGSPGGVSGTTVKRTGGGMTGTKVSPEIKGGATVKDIKKTASKIKDTKTKSKAEIRSAKTTAKQAGKSKQEIRLAKTKAKAKNARIETTSKETAAQGGKKAQEKRAKTIRLEKRAKRIEGRIAKRKAKK
jgi:hypothetical protein|eukprot:COSAG06_NODE_928_length_11474_cov_3.616264_10_plen_257_part_00